MILHSESGDVFAADAFDRLIVQVDVRDLDALGQRVRLQGEAVILRGDLDAAGVAMQDRLIGSAMSKLQLVDFAGKPRGRAVDVRDKSRRPASCRAIHESC